MAINKWHRRMMDVAELVATWSKDPNHKVGAVLTSLDNRILATGFNGFPKHVEVAPSACGSTIHAEVNALLAARMTAEHKKMYVTRCPCLSCAACMIQAGVIKVITRPPEPESHWFKEMNDAVELLKQRAVEVIFIA